MSKMFRSVNELCSVISHIIYCVDDNTILLTAEGSDFDYWIPSEKCVPPSCWEEVSQKEMKNLFESDMDTKIMRIIRFWVPFNSEASMYHVIYEVKCYFPHKKKSVLSEKYGAKIKWLTEAEIIKLGSTNALRSPEIIDLIKTLKTPQQKGKSLPDDKGLQSFGEMPAEYVQRGVLVEISEFSVVMLDTANYYGKLVQAAGYHKEGQHIIYSEYLFRCFPAMYMSRRNFCTFAEKIGWPADDSFTLFKSADMSNRGALSFRDFLYVLAAIDPVTNHGGASGEIRCRYIFRFFDVDGDNLLNKEEFKNLMINLKRVKKQTFDVQSLNREVEQTLKGIADSGTSISVTAFLRSVGDLKFRGTSSLLRAPNNILIQIMEMQDQGSGGKKGAKVADTSQVKTMYNEGQKMMDSGKEFSYSLAVHTLQLEKDCSVVNIERIINIEGAVTKSCELQSQANNPEHRVSLDFFNQSSLANELMKYLRYLATINHFKQKINQVPLLQWGQLNPVDYCNCMLQVCEQTKDILLKESRCLTLTSPIYVLGDLHGNYLDILYFERVLWNFGVGLCPCDILFLGDYVDRGAFSVEVIAYLFASKLSCPQKVFLLRGNHEIRGIQKLFTFQNECILKFGENLGKQLWNAVNRTFDAMPLAGVIDKKIFCCHGGIPPPWLCPVVSAITSIPVPLPDPEKQNLLAWELMWNDPVRVDNMNDNLVMELMSNDGFAANTRRGTGHVWSADALERFLSVNNLSHVIRAHEVVQNGFTIQQNGKLLTVFSSSRYCGSNNEAACVIAERGKIRILRMTLS